MLLLIVLGFVMATAGIALLFLGEVPFLGGRRIPARRARLLGLVLVSFLPMTVGVRQLVILLFGSEAVAGYIITLSVFGFCWFLVAILLFRVQFPKGGRGRRAGMPQANATVKENPFKAPVKTKPTPAPVKEKPIPIVNIEFVPIPEPQPPGKERPAAKKPSTPSESPFDFS